MDQATSDDLRRRLDDERLNVLGQLRDMGVDPETGNPRSGESEQGFADSGQATAEKALSISMTEGLMETLHEVDAALERMAKGTYGKCESCGADIPPERLDARPVAWLCLDCKQRLG